MGVNGGSSWMSEGTAEMGRLLTIPVTSTTRVPHSSWVSSVHPIPSNIPSNTCRTVPICRSHTPPKCNACGVLNIHSQPCSARYHSMSSNNPEAGLMNCSARDEASLVMDIFVEVVDDQLRYVMTF